VRAATLPIALALVAAACATDGDDRSGAGPGVRGRPVEQVAPTEEEDTPSALADMTDGRLPPPLVDPSEVISGGPPPDGIPAIDEPTFVSAGEVDWLDDDEPVLALSLGDEYRAYPVQVLTWHEIVNDTVDGRPVAVTYCPLCNSAIAYDRRLEARVLTFGTSGRLYRSALVMFDRQTESLWTHFDGRAIAGVLTGRTLRAHAVSTVAWSDFRRAHPDALVLSRDTGFERDYGRNPYPGYDDVDTSPFLFEGEADGRFAAKTRVVGVDHGGDALAVVADALRRQGVVEVDLAGVPLTVWWKPGTASALDDGQLAEGRDVGATAVFDARLDGRTLRFRAVGDGFEDRETGSRWDIFGVARSGPLAGSSLTALPHVDTFWFAWAAYQPETAVES
jgi:hypothetical protein